MINDPFLLVFQLHTFLHHPPSDLVPLFLSLDVSSDEDKRQNYFSLPKISVSMDQLEGRTSNGLV